VIGGEGDDAAERWIEALEAVEIDLREARGGDVALFDPAGELPERGVGDLFVGGGEGAGIGGAADEDVFGGAGDAESGLHAADEGPGRDVGLEGNFARAGAALVEGRHGLTPVLRGFGAFGFGHLDADELFGFGEGGGGDCGPNGGRGAEGGRLAGRGRRSRGRGGGLLGGGGRGGDGCAEESQGGLDEKFAAGSVHACLGWWVEGLSTLMKAGVRGQLRRRPGRCCV